MKILRMLTAIIAVSVIVFTACVKEDSAETLTNESLNAEATLEYPKTILTQGELASMLYEYEVTRAGISQKALGQEDPHINTFNFETLKNYIATTEALALEKDIDLKGLTFIKVVFDETTAETPEQIGKEGLIYMPAIEENGNYIPIDIVNSQEQKPVDIASALSTSNYVWRYNNTSKIAISTAAKNNIEKIYVGGNLHKASKEALTTAKMTKMLQAYDDTRIEVYKQALGFEDSRMYTFNLEDFKAYLTFVEKLATEKNIKLKGLSFIKGVYNEETAHNKNYIGYENLIYTPTAIVNGQEVQIDVVNSELGKVTLLQEVLGNMGYEWKYTVNEILKKTQSYSAEKTKIKQQFMLKSSSGKSGAGNWGNSGIPKK